VPIKYPELPNFALRRESVLDNVYGPQDYWVPEAASMCLVCVYFLNIFTHHRVPSLAVMYRFDAELCITDMHDV
jgi:hypothetical protein